MLDLFIMENLSSLTDEALLKTTKDLAARERELTLRVLRHLREVERRQLFAAQGYSSLFEYAVKELAYSEGAAHRRISSMRLLKSLPVLEARVESGSLPLSTLAQAQTFFRQEKITAPELKLELLAQLEGKSSREVEKMEELRALLSHRHPGMSLKDLLAFAVDESLKKHRVKEPKIAVPGPAPAPAPDSLPTLEVASKAHVAKAKHLAKSPDTPLHKRRYVPVEIRRQVWFRDRRIHARKSSAALCHSQPSRGHRSLWPPNDRALCAPHGGVALQRSNQIVEGQSQRINCSLSILAARLLKSRSRVIKGMS